jgi:hypothetical protein
MINNLYILITLNIIIFILGYLLGQYNRKIEYDRPTSFLSKNKNAKEVSQKIDIDIDERKIVTKINTDNLEKKYDSLAQTQVSQNDIGESINKLKNLKR